MPASVTGNGILPPVRLEVNYPNGYFLSFRRSRTSGDERGAPGRYVKRAGLCSEFDEGPSTFQQTHRIPRNAGQSGLAGTGSAPERPALFAGWFGLSTAEQS